MPTLTVDYDVSELPPDLLMMIRKISVDNLDKAPALYAALSAMEGTQVNLPWLEGKELADALHEALAIRDSFAINANVLGEAFFQAVAETLIQMAISEQMTYGQSEAGELIGAVIVKRVTEAKLRASLH
ncbi:MAG: hypothetical protein BMS9Abin36_0797 [Gammaproteobacteria bacterium]|nr:MAG: hypothetical protein BMS9Abin36_0797 [Gammaproteobacteria bacterium]